MTTEGESLFVGTHWLVGCPCPGACGSPENMNVTLEGKCGDKDLDGAGKRLRANVIKIHCILVGNFWNFQKTNKILVKNRWKKTPIYKSLSVDYRRSRHLSVPQFPDGSHDSSYHYIVR